MQISINETQQQYTITLTFQERQTLLTQAENAYHLGALTLFLLSCDTRPMEKYEELPSMLGRTVRNVIKNGQQMLSVCTQVLNVEGQTSFFLEKRDENKNTESTFLHTESIPQATRDHLRELCQQSGVRLSQVYASLIRHKNKLDFVTGLLRDISMAPDFQRVRSATGLFVDACRKGTRLDLPAGVREEQEVLDIQAAQKLLEAQRKEEKAAEDRLWREAMLNSLMEGMTVRYRGAEYTLASQTDTALMLSFWTEDGEVQEVVPVFGLQPENFTIVQRERTQRVELQAQKDLDIASLVENALSAGIEDKALKFLKGLNLSALGA